jgi:hypothetical protein
VDGNNDLSLDFFFFFLVFDFFLPLDFLASALCDLGFLDEERLLKSHKCLGQKLKWFYSIDIFLL